jgi:hypothetical protein
MPHLAPNPNIRRFLRVYEVCCDVHTSRTCPFLGIRVVPKLADPFYDALEDLVLHDLRTVTMVHSALPNYHPYHPVPLAQRRGP